MRLYDTRQRQPRLAAARPGRRRAADQAQGHRRRADRQRSRCTRSDDADAAPTTSSASPTAIEAELKRVPGTREVTTIGGPGRAVLVEIDPARLAGAGVDRRRPAPRRCSRPTSACRSATCSAATARCARRGRPVPARRRATSASWWSACTPASRCSCRTWPTSRDGAAAAAALRLARRGRRRERRGEFPAVTIAITKKPGENADRRRRRGDAPRRRAAQHRHPARRRGRRDAQLRRHRQRQGAAS